MSFHSWLQNLRSTLAPGRGQGHHARRWSLRTATHRLNVEALEDRSVPAFLAPVVYDVAAGPIAVVTADFNGDGHLDLATASFYAYPDVSVLLGNGDGTFQAAKNYSVGSIGSMAVGDFNGDGKDELVIGTCTPDGTGDFWHGSVAVLLGNGDGSFQYSTFLTGDPTVGVAVADFDADGKLDLAVTGLSDSSGFAGVVVMLGRGDGTFVARSYVGVPNYGLLFTQSVVTGDFNRDGKVDLAWIDQWSGIGEHHLGNGNGTFAGATPFVDTDDYFPVAVNVVEAVGDFNGDGRLDMAAAVSWDNSVWVFLDDGDGPPLTPSLRIRDVTVTEGNTGTASATFTVTLASASTEVITVDYSTGNGAAIADSDFNSTSGTVTFAPGETSKTITVPVIGDRRAEPNETFVVNLSNPTNATIADGQAIGTIVDDEPRISISDVSQKEGNSGLTAFTFTVSLSVPCDVPVTIGYSTANGTATAGSDYQAASGTLTIPAGQTSGTITVQAIGDRLPESNETFFVNLSNSNYGVLVDGQGVGTILDDEPRISIGEVSKQEGKKGQTTLFTFTVTLSAAYDQAVTMSFATANGTATSGSGDYVAKSGTLTFAPGETRKTITIEVKGDAKREADKYFYLDLSGNSSNSWFTKSRGIGIILNDD